MTDHQVLLEFLRPPDAGARHYAKLKATLESQPGLHIADVSDRADHGTEGSYALMATVSAPSSDDARKRVSALLGEAATTTHTCAAARVMCRAEARPA